MRKPGNGMIMNAFKDWKINKKNSFLIGDSETDIIAGRKSLLKSYFVKKDIYRQISSIIT